MNKERGQLYIIATPIGNLKDITYRAVETLSSVDYILAEDTRHTQHLLGQFQIKNKLVSLHDHNESDRISKVSNDLDQGLNIALVSDAGTPLISDPGYKLVHALGQEDFTITPIPGASACISALSVSGLPSDAFYFAGFLPAKAVAREKKLQGLLEQNGTLIFYESSHRIMDSLASMKAVFEKGRDVVLAKELTKQFEAIVRGSFDEVLAWLEVESERQKGEFVILVSGMDNKNRAEKTSIGVEALLKLLLPEMPLKRAVAIVVEVSGAKKNEVYKQALALS